MQRTALGVMKIAAQAKTKSSNFEAGKYQRPADFNKPVSIITVMNLKGGVCKSTIAVNLACELAAQRSVVVVDPDSQGTAADWARRGELPARVEALPLDTDDEVGPWVEQVLNTGADHVIVDCPPHLGPATLAAAGIADMVLIPVTPSGADLVATELTLGLVHDAQLARKDGGPLCLLVPSKVDRRTGVGRELAGALERFGEIVGPEIGQRTALVDAFAAGAWIGDYAPRNGAREQFSDLVTAIKRRWLMEMRRAQCSNSPPNSKVLSSKKEVEVG